ncbi:MAG TPA: tRNA-intron lyase [Candidatus Altiarchaeales archaeon]|nr:tRNA-intron lyase [Candidatus Altiarchaeales archaeon]
MGVGILSGTKVLVGDGDTKSILKQRGYGEEVEGQHVISIIEAVYLLEQGALEIMSGGEKLSVEDLIGAGGKAEQHFYNKYLVYRDLRNRGLLVRSGLKFGSDFRIYERGGKLGEAHSTKLVHVVPEEYTCSFPELSRAIRLAGNVNKQMIYAIVDEESDITYYLVDRVKL